MAKFFGKSTYTGFDVIKFYDIDSATIGIVQVQEWDDLIGERERVSDGLPKYNAMAGIVCIYGFDAHTKPGSVFGPSVHDALRSCGFYLANEGERAPTDHFQILNDYDHTVVVEGKLSDKSVRMCIAQCLWDYGAKDVLSDDSSNNARKLERQARQGFLKLA